MYNVASFTPLPMVNDGYGAHFLQPSTATQLCIKV